MKRTVLAIFLIFAISMFLLMGVKAHCIGATYNFTCGETINESCAMDEDLSINGSTCFTVGAASITLDGAGYTITGNDTLLTYGLYSDGYSNITIKNFIIEDFDYGIVYSSSGNSRIENNNVSSCLANGIHISTNALPVNITNNLVSSCAVNGIFIESTATPIISNNIIDTSATGLGLVSSNAIVNNNTIFDCLDKGMDIEGDYANITNNNLTNNTNYNYYIYLSNYNNLINNTASTSSNGYRPVVSYGNLFLNNTVLDCSYGYFFYYSYNNTIKDNFINGSTNDGIHIERGASSNNLFQNVQINNSANYDIFIDGNDEDIANNTFLNVTYDLTKVNTTKGGLAYFKWYLDAYVNDTSGNPIDSAFVTIYDNTNTLAFNVTTNSSGYITRQNITEYFENETDRYYLTNYSANASFNYLTSNTQLVNLTTNHMVNDGTEEILTLGGIGVGCAGVDYTFICGETINESCTMNGNLTNNGTCFTIGAADIIIDGNGNSITGNGTGIGIAGNGYSNITIQNIKIDYFESGTQILNGNTYTILNSTIQNCTQGTWQIYALNYLIENCTFRNNPSSIYMGGFTPNSVIRGNRFYNGGAGNFEVYLGTQNLIVENNYFENNGYWSMLLADDAGDTASNITVRHNLFNNSPGIYDVSDSAKIYNNTANGQALFNCINCKNGIAYNNTVNSTRFGGFYISTNYTVINNSFYGNNVSLFCLSFQGGSYNNVTVSHNYFENYSGNMINTMDSVGDLINPIIIEYNIFNITDTQQHIFLVGTNGTTNTKNVIIRYNEFYDHDISRVLGDSADIGVWYADNITIHNNTHYRGYDQGIWTWGLTNSEIYNERFYDCDCMPYQTERRNFNNSWHDNYARNFTQGLIGIWFGSSNNNYSNFVGEDAHECFQLLGRDDYNNIFTNITCTAANSSETNSYGVILGYLVDDEGSQGAPSNNTFINITLNNFYYGIFAEDGGENNTFIDSVIFNSTIDDIYVHNSALLEPNITLYLFNVSFNKSSTLVTKGAYYNKYYLDAYVNDTSGNPIDNAYVTIYDNTNALLFNVTTNSSGYITRQNITEYFENETDRYYLTNYSANASNSTLYSNTSVINLTTNTAIDDGTQIVLTISNSYDIAPTISNVRLNSTYSNKRISCLGTYADAESELENGSTYRWFRDGVLSLQTTKSIAPNTFSAGDLIICEYTPCDNSACGTAVNSSATRLINAPSTEGGNSGGTTGGGASQSTFATSKKCFDKIENQQIIIELSDQDKKTTGVDKISFFYGGTAKNPCITLSGITLGNQTFNEINYSAGNTYKIFKIETELLDKDKIGNTTLEITILNEWLDTRENQTLKLIKNSEFKLDGWQMINLEFIKRDDTRSYFTARLSNLSVFLIMADLKKEFVNVCGNNFCELNETTENCCTDCGCGAGFECKGNTCEKIVQKKSSAWTIVAICGVFAIILVLILIKALRKKKHHY